MDGAGVRRIGRQERLRWDHLFLSFDLCNRLQRLRKKGPSSCRLPDDELSRNRHVCNDPGLQILEQVLGEQLPRRGDRSGESS